MYKLHVGIWEAPRASVCPYTQHPIAEGKAVALSAARFPG